MRYKRMDGEHEVWCAVNYAGAVSFGADALGTEYPSEEARDKALQAYELRLRKNFSNRTAYSYDAYGGKFTVFEVEVTSVDGNEAWTKTAKGRSKRRVAMLFADKNLLTAALGEDAAISDRSKAEREALWTSVARWTPEEPK